MVQIIRRRYILGFILATIMLIAGLFLWVNLVNAQVTYTLTVNAASDGTGGAGDCELRDAIIAINTGTNVDGCTFAGVPDIDGTAPDDDFVINFDTSIVGPLGPAPTITLTSPLPAITSTVVLNGNAAGGTNVTVQGPGGGTGFNFTTVGDPATTPNAAGSSIDNFTITGFERAIQVNDIPNVSIGTTTRNEIISNGRGIVLLGDDTDNTTIQNNFIGVDDSNTILANLVDGIFVGDTVTNTTISNNTISSNGRHGIFAQNVDGLTIQNNIIGLPSTLTLVNRGNAGSGVFVNIGQNVNISNNTVGYNGGFGVFVNAAPDTTIDSNNIGSLANVTDNVGNGNAGVYVSNSNGTSITNSFINFNGGQGVAVVGSQGVDINVQSIFGNGSIGIDMDANGVSGIGGTFSNGGLNYMNLLAASTDGANIQFNGTFTAPAGNYELVVFYNDTGQCDPSGFGEGQNRIGTVGITPGTVSLNIGAGGANVGDFLSVYTRQIGVADPAASEFSRCIEITDSNLEALFLPTGALTINQGQTIFLDNISTGLIDNVEWTVTGPTGTFTVNTYDFLQNFTVPGTYTISLEVFSGANSDVSDLNLILTVLAPTAIPPTPIPPTPVPVTPVPATDVPPVDTSTPTLTVIASSTSTSTTVPTNTAIPTNTALPTNTLIPTSTRTDVPTRTPIPTSTTVPTSTTAPTNTAVPTSTLVPTDTETAIPTITTTPDVDVTKTSDGDDEMNLSIVNVGESPVSNVVIQELLRENVEFRSVLADGVTCVEVGGLVSCQIGDLDAGDVATLDFSLQTNGADPASGQTSVIVDGSPIEIVDEPFISKVGNPPIAEPGSQIVYTIRVINPTDETAIGVTVTDEMPEVIQILSGSATAGTVTIAGQDVTLKLAELGPGERVTLTLITRVRDDEIFEQIINVACLNSSSNASPRCAQMAFLAVGELPLTGQVSWAMRMMRWAGVLTLVSIMFAGIFTLQRRLKKPRE
ncbi:MAG: right-handed parallel beta-helix repeat-containing protein [Chloroflexota bacterium]